VEAGGAQRNIEVNRRIVAAFNRGGLEGIGDYFAEDVVFEDPDLPSRIEGRKALFKTLGAILEGFDAWYVKKIDMYPKGDMIVSVVHSVGHGEGTRGEMEIEVHDAHVSTFADGKVVRWRVVHDVREAFRQAGLDPDAPGEPHSGVS
jgi:ketosteroid isomerase-like protein